MKINWKERLNNYGMWTSGLSLIGLICVDVFKIDLGHFNLYANAILGFVIAIGLVNNPLDGKGYSDK